VNLLILLGEIEFEREDFNSSLHFIEEGLKREVKNGRGLLKKGCLLLK
jgi:hypothetical protein